MNIRIPKMAEVVADQIRRKIVRGEISEGEHLPLESAMLAEYSVSRPTLREAFRILESERLIAIGRGARTGPLVNRPTAENAARYMAMVLESGNTTIHDIYEARLAIEPFIAHRLAQQRSNDVVEQLSNESAKLHKLVEQNRYIDFMIGISSFHQLMVELGGNKTLALVIKMLHAIVARHQVNYFERHKVPLDEQRKRAFRGLRSFKVLIDYIQRGEADKAQSHWYLHVQNANNHWVTHEDVDKVISSV